MLQEIIDLQNNAVNNILSLLPLKDNITFKSPTGSGKTYMMADLMNKILEIDNDVVFIVSSLSKGELAKQNYEKFMDYSNSRAFEKINPYLINSDIPDESSLHISTDYNVYVLPRDLYKDKSKLKQGAFLNFLNALKNPKPLGLNKKIYIIKDECHIETSNLDSLAEKYFEKTINFSATPHLGRGQKPDVEITELDAINAKLIKKVEFQPDYQGVDVALNKFKELKKEYNELLGINPCLIIQISNKEKADEEINNLKSLLNKHDDLKWMLILDDEKKCDTNDVFKAKKLSVKKWKNYAKSNTATIDIIIFKMVITEGWDIPRACMLYQLRDSKSKQLDEQVIGRVRRNPCLLQYEKLNHKAKQLISSCFVWGLKPKDSKSINEIKLIGEQNNNIIHNEIKLKTTKIKRPSENSILDIDVFLSNQKEKVIPTDIFTLYKKYNKSTNEVKELYSSYIDKIPKWFTFLENIDEITKESKNIICDYDKNMELHQDENGNDVLVSFPLISYYIDNGNYINIGNWIWQKSNDDQFSFDSEAERQWASILVSLTSKEINNESIVKSININDSNDSLISSKKYLIGKNFLSNSEIKYEYYFNGIHASYPDFIMKDYKNNIHIFETKSLNKSNDTTFDINEYEEKINALKKAYKYASKLTGYYFYIPIKNGLNWTIYKYFEGNEEMIDENEFKKSFGI